MSSADPNAGAGRELLSALDVAAVSSSRKLAERDGAPAFRLVREIGPKLQPPLVRPLLVTGFEEGWLVLEHAGADQFRLRWVAEDGLSSRTIAELARGNADAELEEPAALAMDRNGQICVLDASDGRIRRFSQDGRWLETIAPQDPAGAVPAGARDLAADAGGSLLVADTNNDRVLWLAEGGTIDRISDEGIDLFEPRSLCASDERAALVADTNNNRLVLVMVDGASRAIVDGSQQLEFPTRVRTSFDGKSLFVLDKSGSRVQRFTLDGKQTGSLAMPAAGESAGSSDLAVDGQGNAVLLNPVRQSIVVLAFQE